MTDNGPLILMPEPEAGSFVPSRKGIYFAVAALATGLVALATGPGAALLTGGMLAGGGAFYHAFLSADPKRSDRERVRFALSYGLVSLASLLALGTVPALQPPSEHNQPYKVNEENVLKGLWVQGRQSDTSDVRAPNYFSSYGKPASMPVQGFVKEISGNAMHVIINGRTKYVQVIENPQRPPKFNMLDYAGYMKFKK